MGAGDQIYISSTFYDETLNTKQSKDQVIKSSGAIVYEKAYKGERNYFAGVNFVKDGVYYSEKQEDAIHLMHLSFLTGETTDYGPVAKRDDWEWISEYISPDGTYVLLKDREALVARILELKK